MKKYVFVERGKHRDDTLVIFGPFNTKEEARQFATGRILLAAEEDWGLESGELITDMFKWSIESCTK